MKACATTASSPKPSQKRPLGRRDRRSKLKRKISAGETLLVAKLDRLRRRALDVPTLIDVQKKLGVAMRILNLGIDTSGAGGKLFLLLLAGFAKFERNIIRERVLSGLENAKARGTRLGRRPPFPRKTSLRPDASRLRGLPREAPSLLQVFRMTAWQATNFRNPYHQSCPIIA